VTRSSLIASCCPLLSEGPEAATVAAEPEPEPEAEEAALSVLDATDALGALANAPAAGVHGTDSGLPSSIRMGASS